MVRSRVYPRLKDFALRALTHVLRLSEISGDRDPFVLDGALDPRSVAVMGFSAGGPLALYAAEASQRLWPGAVKAAVAIAPTVGVSEWALDQFEREAPECMPMMRKAHGDRHLRIIGSPSPWAVEVRRGMPKMRFAQPSCCLLYTSPSPRDLSTSRMPSSA